MSGVEADRAKLEALEQRLDADKQWISEQQRQIAADQQAMTTFR